MADYVLHIAPIVIPFVFYLIRIERALAKLKTDVCWIKKTIHPPKE